MTLWVLVWRELLVRRGSTVAGVLAVACAVGAVVCVAPLLRAHEENTARMLDTRREALRQQMTVMEDEYRKIMLKLGLNLLIFPSTQSTSDLYDKDYVTGAMPESAAATLVNARLMSIQHVLPVLQAKVEWPERKRTMLLVGTRGEMPVLGGKEKKPVLQAVAPGSIALGYDLHHGLDLKAGDTLTLMGRRFVVSRTNPMRGDREDVAAWIDLAQAQEMLGRPGEISAIYALECVCSSEGLATIREDVARVLPNTTVVEFGSQAAARAEARAHAKAQAEAEMAAEQQGRDTAYGRLANLAALVVPLVALGSTLWVGLLALANARERRFEIGYLRAMGVSASGILWAIVARALVVGVAGAALGIMGGAMAGILAGRVDPRFVLAALNPATLVLALVLAPLLAALVTLPPAWLAAREEPATVLGDE